MSIIKNRKRVVLVFLLLFPLLTQQTSALEYSTRFNTCAQMKKQYRFGVALSLKISGDYPAKISKLIYQRNKGLDFDYDGIVCENETLQRNLNPSATQVPTTSSTVQPVTTNAPLPTSPVFVEFRNGSSITLRRGVTYQIYLCADSAGAVSYMDYLSIKTGWTQKAIGVDLLDATRCSNPGFPYRTSHGWFVTENPGEVTSIRMRGWTENLQMTVVITN
jgi:hypothetical protein